MKRTRIHELAREWGLQPKELLAKLERLGIRGRKSQSSLSPDEAERVKAELGLQGKPAVTLGEEHVVEERVVTAEEQGEQITTRHQVVESRVRPNVIRRRDTVIEVVRSQAPPTPELGMPPVGDVLFPESGSANEDVPPSLDALASPAAQAGDAEPSPVTEKAVTPADGDGATAAAEPEEVPAEPRPAPPEPPPLIDAEMRPVRVLGKIDLHRAARPPAAGRRPELRAESGANLRTVPAGPGPTPAGQPPADDRKRKKRKVIKKPDLFETPERSYRPGRMPRKKRALPGREQKQTEITTPKASKRVVKISEVISVGDLARAMGVKAGDVLKKLMGLGVMATINHSLDADTAALVAAEFDYNVENVAFDAESVLGTQGEDVGTLAPRPPVIAVMGHVDHGKTSLLDAIRQTNVAEGEVGGITQHIGASRIDVGSRSITVLDTPGHEAFTGMRARGAKVTDIVILVVAADDGVMPQTLEAINHARAASVPIIVAINKIDRPDADPERVQRQLAEHALVPEEWGGQTICVRVSAKTRQGIPQLLEMIVLQADVLEVRAAPDRMARGTIIEAKLERGRGPVATVLVQEGTLRTGQVAVCGTQYGRIRAMNDWRGQRLTEAGPGTAVEIIGLTGVPEAGDGLAVVTDEASARRVAEHRRAKQRESDLASKAMKVSLEDLYEQIQTGAVKELRVVLKADVQGSVEALSEALRHLSTDQVKATVLHGSVGGITESDVLLASASHAVVIGFHVRPEAKASDLAQREGVEVRLYDVIYEAINDIRDALEGLIEPTYREKVLGRAEVRQTFGISGVGTVAGCFVVEGRIPRAARVRVVRDHVVAYDGRIGSLRRFKEDVREVAAGYECGIGIENFQDLKLGDVLEAYEVEAVTGRIAAPRAQEPAERRV